jgi:hypothetical protein
MFSLFFIHIFLILWTHIYKQHNTETKDWHQRFLVNVQRNLHNWWKCVGTKIPINVLYPLSLSIFFSMSIFSNCVFVLICELHTHTHTHTQKLNESFSLSHTLFCFLLIVVFLDLKLVHTTNRKSFETICEMLQQWIFDIIYGDWAENRTILIVSEALSNI